MKIFCEVRNEVQKYDESPFNWLKGPNNLLFFFENKRKLILTSIKQLQQLDAAQAHVIRSASLADKCYGTSLSWNKDGSLLAIVIDRRQIFIWDVQRDKITPLKPLSMSASSRAASNGSSANVAPSGSGQPMGPRRGHKFIELVAFSKLSNKLAICYSSGQILLCKLTTQVSAPGSQQVGQVAVGAAGGDFSTTCERFIDNSESVLKKIVSIEVSEHTELFACFSAISEILIMSFDGQLAFYGQGDRANLYNAKFSPLRREHCPRTGQHLGQTICLAYQSEHDVILTKKIAFGANLDYHERGPPIVHELHENQQVTTSSQQQQDLRDCGKATHLVDYHWVGPTHLLLCFASGSIQMIQMDATTTGSVASSPTSTTGGGVIVQSVNSSGQHTLCTELLRLDPRLDLAASSSQESSSVSGFAEHEYPTIESIGFKIFEVIKAAPRGPPCDSPSPSYALAIGTCYKLYYYELIQEPSGEFNLEHFDDLDLSESLQRMGLKLERAGWSYDSSMLAVQITNGNLLVCRTRLQDCPMASHGSRAAYLSAPNEVTILNYAGEQQADETASQASGSQVRAVDKAHILSVKLRPSLLAIGPRHLALALNNRVRFYPLDSLDQSGADDEPGNCQVREYAAIVSGVGLCSRFAAVQFEGEGRLKLHSLSSASEDGEERLFPDPSQPERISSFSLTEQLLVYSTHNCQLAVFCLKSWRLAQVCDYSDRWVSPFTQRPIWRLKPNASGNKFICLTEPNASGSLPASADSIRRRPVTRRKERGSVLFLYDLYTNDVCAISGCSESNETQPLWSSLVSRQIELACGATLPVGATTVNRLLREIGVLGQKKVGNVMDVIWDTDGRTVLLIEQKIIHSLAVLDHTLEREGPIVEYAASAKKPSSYTTLYVHQGIVSYRTGPGRLINSILETHDDELKLIKLEMRIQTIKRRFVRSADGEDEWAREQGDCEPAPSDEMLLEAELEVMLLKVSYLLSLVPIYPLSRCRDICEHLMEDEAFILDANAIDQNDEHAHHCQTINKLIWQILAAWSLFTLNLDFASLIYRQNQGLEVLANKLTEIKIGIKAGGSNATTTIVNKRILALLDPTANDAAP